MSEICVNLRNFESIWACCPPCTILCLYTRYYPNSHAIESARESSLLIIRWMNSRELFKLFAKFAGALIADNVSKTRPRIRSRFRENISDKEKLARVREQSRSSSSRTVGFVLDHRHRVSR